MPFSPFQQRPLKPAGTRPWVILCAAGVSVFIGGQYAIAAVCPCEHKAPGHSHATGSKPLSEKHAQCVAPMDSYLAWLAAEIERLPTGSINRSAYEMSLKHHSVVDYSRILPRAVYASILESREQSKEELVARAAAATTEAESLRAQVASSLDEIDLEAAVEDQQHYDQQLRESTAISAHYRCMLDAGLYEADVVAKACPCEHKAPGLTYISSSQPMSETHAKCAEPVDKYVKWAKEQLASAASNNMSAMAIDLTVRASLKMDFAAPTRQDAEDSLELAKRDFSAAAAEAGAKSADANLATKRADANNENGPVELVDEFSAVRAIENAGDKMTANFKSASKMLNENTLQFNAALIAYNQCLLKNNIAK